MLLPPMGPTVSGVTQPERQAHKPRSTLHLLVMQYCPAQCVRSVILADFRLYLFLCPFHFFYALTCSLALCQLSVFFFIFRNRTTACRKCETMSDLPGEETLRTRFVCARQKKSEATVRFVVGQRFQYSSWPSNFESSPDLEFARLPGRACHCAPSTSRLSAHRRPHSIRRVKKISNLVLVICRPSRRVHPFFQNIALTFL